MSLDKYLHNTIGSANNSPSELNIADILMFKSNSNEIVVITLFILL